MPPLTARKKITRQNKKLQAQQNRASKPSTATLKAADSHDRARSPHLPISHPPSSAASPGSQFQSGNQPTESRSGVVLKQKPTLGPPTSTKSPEGVLSEESAIPIHQKTKRSRPGGLRSPIWRNPTAIAIALGFGVVVVVSIGLFLVKVVPAVWVQSTVCNTEVCEQMNAMLAEAIDRRVEPCQNFYRHVCGRWPDKHKGFSVYDVNVNALFENLQSFLAQINVGSQEGPTEKMARFYSTCAAIVVDGQNQLEDFQRVFHEAGIHWPNIRASGPKDLPDDAFYVAAKAYNYFSISSVLTIRSRRLETGEAYLHFEPGMWLPIWLEGQFAFKNDSDEAHSYRAYYNHAVSLYSGSQANQAADFNEFLEIEGAAAEALYFKDQYAGTLTLNSTEQLSHIVNATRLKRLEEYFVKQGQLPVAPLASVQGKKYLEHFARLVNTLGDAKVVFYIGWIFLQAVWRVLDRKTSTQWYETFGGFSSRAVVHLPDADCLGFAESLFGWTLFHRFLKTNRGESPTKIVATMMEHVAERFLFELGANAWLGDLGIVKENFTEVLYHQKRFNEITLLARLVNLTDMTGSLPDNWVAAARALRGLTDEARRDLITAYMWRLRISNGYFALDPVLHQLRVPPLYAELPLFGGDSSTLAATYGALGTVIGAAAVQLIIEKASVKPSAALQDRVRCFTNSSNDKSLEPVYLSAAVDPVYKAYQYRLPQVDDKQDLADFNRDVSFFQVMCYLLCQGAITAEVSIAEMTCNQAVKYSTQFDKVFGCVPGTPMYTAEKCRFFH